jgi:putative ABC transport system permease protein
VLALCGVGVGLAGTIAMSRVLRTLIVGTDHLDTLLFGGAATVMIAAVGAATFCPALRVLRVDPAEALRAD